MGEMILDYPVDCNVIPRVFASETGRVGIRVGERYVVGFEDGERGQEPRNAGSL